MSSITIIKKDITKMNTDCIVNAANSSLMAGGGVCGAIFRAAGYQKMQRACDQLEHCPTGGAVITPGFDLKAKYVIHAVGPVWHGGINGEPEDLYNCYRKSLELVKENGCHSITFPLISSGIFGYPKEKAWEKAIQSCIDYLDLNEDYDIDIYFAVIDDIAKAMGEKVLQRMLETDEDDEESQPDIIEAPFEEGGPYLEGCPALEEALSDWHVSDKDEDLAQVMDVLVREIGNGMKVIVPVAYDEDDGEIMFQLIAGDDDENWMTCFTNKEEKAKGEASSSVVMDMTEVMEKAAGIENCSGIALNPWGDGMFLPMELIEEITEDLKPKTQDELDFQEGLAAYAACDFDKAAEYLKRSAAAGNVAAEGRLGYCYYYGQGLEENLNAAKECWIKAAVFGDVLSTVKLGDLYRTGEFGKDPSFAVQLYHKAFTDACADPNIWTFPEAAMRLLKYASEGYEDEALAGIAEDMAACYGERLRQGDRTCGAALTEAEAILKEFEKK